MTYNLGACRTRSQRFMRQMGSASIVMACALWLAGWRIPGVAKGGEPALAASAISLQIHSPTESQAYAGVLPVAVRVSSLFEIASVTANLEGTSFPLVFSTTAICGRLDCQPGWAAAIPISSLPWGQLRLVVTVQDVFGAKTQTEVGFTHDEPPTLEIQSPRTSTLTSRELRVMARIVNPEPLGNRIEVFLDSTRITESTNAVDILVPLDTQPDAWSASLRVKAYNSLGRSVEQARPILLVADPRLSLTAEFTARVHEFQSDRALVSSDIGEPPGLVIQHRGSLGRVTIPSSHDALGALLTPQGALFVRPASTTPYSTVHEWDGTHVADAGSQNGIQPDYTLVVRGHFAMWNLQTTLVRRDLRARTNLVIAEDVGNNRNDLAANGDVVYWTTGYRIRRHRDGTSIQLADPGSTRRDTYPVTDGTQVVWRRAGFSLSPSSLWMFTAAGEPIELVPEEPREREPGKDYQANGGFVAFTRMDSSGNVHVWQRDPAGNIQRVSYFSGRTGIHALDASGNLLLTAAGRTWLARPGTLPVPTVLPPGFSGFWLGADLMATAGGAYFRATTETPPALRVWASARAQPWVEIWGPIGARLKLQAGPDPLHWVDVQSFTLGSTPAQWLDTSPAVSDSGRFYRLQNITD